MARPILSDLFLGRCGRAGPVVDLDSSLLPHVNLEIACMIIKLNKQLNTFYLAALVFPSSVAPSV